MAREPPICQKKQKTTSQIRFEVWNSFLMLSVFGIHKGTETHTQTHTYTIAEEYKHRNENNVHQHKNHQGSHVLQKCENCISTLGTHVRSFITKRFFFNIVIILVNKNQSTINFKI